MAMVLKAARKMKVPQMIDLTGDKSITESFNNIKESAADSEIYDVAQAINALKVNQCKINIHTRAKDFNIVDDSVSGGSQAQT